MRPQHVDHLGTGLLGGDVQRRLVPGLSPRGRHQLSLAMDQQLTAGVMWGVAGVFIPLIWNLLQWLSSEEDPDEELHRLVREERRRALPPHPTPYRVVDTGT